MADLLSEGQRRFVKVDSRLVEFFHRTHLEVCALGADQHKLPVRPETPNPVGCWPKVALGLGRMKLT